MKYFFLIQLLVVSCADNSKLSLADIIEEISEDTSSTIDQPKKPFFITTNVELDSLFEENEAAFSKEYENVNWLAHEQSMTKDYSFVIVLNEFI